MPSSWCGWSPSRCPGARRPRRCGYWPGQRRRWHRGITEILRRHRTMVGNPRYGRIGLLALPYYVTVELLAPLVELSALVLVPLGLLMGAVNVDFAWRFLLVAY